MDMHYFSYGSNMSERRLKARAPSARKIGVGALDGHQLRFHKVGRVDASAKCDARETGEPGHRVHGVVFDLPLAEKRDLDRREGVGRGYLEKLVCIRLIDGSTVEAFTYIATAIDPNLKPFDWYRMHVLIGARENRLPESYIRLIEAVEWSPDPDPARRQRELSIYDHSLLAGLLGGRR